MGTSASFARKVLSCLAAALLAFTLVPASALAQEEAAQPQDIVDPQAGATQEASADQADAGSGSTPAALSSEGGTLASALVGTPTAFINSDVALDGEPVVGSFTVDGLTFAVTEGSDVELVGVSLDRQQVTSPQEGDGSPVAPMLASGPDDFMLAVPEAISYEGVDYAVTSIGAYAFYLSGVTAVELPATVTDVDDRAFRSSDVASVTVADGNPTYSSFDGALYSADYSSLLLIPEGKQGTVLLPKRAEVADAGKFSHCSLASAISVEEGSAAFASENGLLYDASLTTLLRVPAGATDIVIRDGCTTIAAGAMEACASLATITAPASVTSISPDVFTSVPTVSLPAVLAVADDPADASQADEAEGTFGSEGAEAQQVPSGATSPQPLSASSAEASGAAATQLTAMVALSSADDDLLEVDVRSIVAELPNNVENSLWKSLGLALDTSESEAYASAEGARTSLDSTRINIVANGGLNTIVQYKYDGTYYGTWNNAIQEEIAQYQFSCTGTSWSFTNNRTWKGNGSVARDGYDFAFWGTEAGASSGVSSFYFSIGTARTYYAIWRINVSWDPNGGAWADGSSSLRSETLLDGWAGVGFNGKEIPSKPGFRFMGWATEATAKKEDASKDIVVPNAHTTYFAIWEQIKYDIGFDVDSEPGDEDYPGEVKDDQTIVADQIEAGDKVEIADPKRPGYVFQGWVIPDADGMHAIDQDLVYQDEADGKWYVDASKLPDYANDDGRVELTARWTSVISVDVPSAVTFYADVVTQGNESREGIASGAFGQNKVASQSEVDLRIVGLESTAVATEGSTLGADSILKKSDAATPSSSTQKLFSLYPTDKALTPDDLQDPDAVSTTKPSDAVDFALDDILLEKSFAADSFTIPAGDTLNLGYRLNLSETGTELDYDTLSTLDEGTSASIANISYCFAADYGPVFWTTDDDGSTLELAAIKADAEAIAAGDAATTSKYTRWMNADHRFYVKWYDKGVTEAANPTAATVYDVRIIGLNHDDKSDGSGKAGITFQLVDLLKDLHTMNATATTQGGWRDCAMRASMLPGGTLWGQLPAMLRDAIVEVGKATSNSDRATAAISMTSDRLFLLTTTELFGAATQGKYEGSRYAYWMPAVATEDIQAASSTVKHREGTNTGWFLRTACDTVSGRWKALGSFGVFDITGDYGSFASTDRGGVCPAFCL